MANRYWQDGNAVGGRVFLGDWVTGIGVVGDAKYTTLTPPVPYMYLPLSRYYRPAVTLVVRSAADPGTIIGPIREAVRSLDANLPLFDVRPFAEHRDIAVFIPRMAATLLGCSVVSRWSWRRSGCTGCSPSPSGSARRRSACAWRAARGATTSAGWCAARRFG